MANITIHTAVYRRPEVWPYFVRSIHRLQEANPGHKIITIVAYSENERAHIQAAGFYGVRVPNRPLGKKLNAAMSRAVPTNPDFVLCLGSDDLVSENILDAYLKDPRDLTGVQDGYFLHMPTGRMLYWGGYVGKRAGETAGMGRMLSRRLLEKLKWKPWADHLNRNVDSSFWKKAARFSPRIKTLNCRRDKIMLLDLKGPGNLTPFEQWPNTVFMDPRVELKGHLPEYEFERLRING